ncbi:MAG: ABC transporter permease [Dehalococcoidia bacterium]
MLAAVRRTDSFGRRFSRDGGGLIAAVLLAFLLTISLLAGSLGRGDPFRTSRQRLQAPSASHLLGTDDLGRDQFTRILYGARTSLLVGLTVSLLSTTIGVVVGGVASYAGGLLDDGLMRITEFFQIVPRFFAALVVAAIFGARLATVILILGLTSWTVTARILRAEVLSIKQREFITAAAVLGADGTRLLWRHILPNALSPVIVTASLQVGGAILAEAGLAFLGIGDRTVVSWGSMLQAAQPFARAAPWLAIAPGLGITVTVLAVNRLGDALNDARSPRRLRRRNQ